MSFEEVKELMREVGWGAFATTDGEKVGVRPMGGWAWMGGELWCATGRSSDKVSQLGKVPHAEYCFGNPMGKHVRISGPCTVSTDDEVKRKLYDAVPLLQRYISSPTDPEYVVLRMKPDRIRLMATVDQKYEDVAATE